MAKPGFWRRVFICSIGGCPCAPKSDDTGVWGECVLCEKRTGFVDSATLRRYLDRELDARAGYYKPPQEQPK